MAVGLGVIADDPRRVYPHEPWNLYTIETATRRSRLYFDQLASVVECSPHQGLILSASNGQSTTRAGDGPEAEQTFGPSLPLRHQVAQARTMFGHSALEIFFLLLPTAVSLYRVLPYGRPRTHRLAITLYCCTLSESCLPRSPSLLFETGHSSSLLLTLPSPLLPFGPWVPQAIHHPHLLIPLNPDHGQPMPMPMPNDAGLQTDSPITSNRPPLG
ncbi:hypothetical protein C8034_v007459 [Colletotrichum sidae]|uniref:Uncharacterized protein n=1 Tax=Colletotrichum sidae TaxID=1347389 RepID=A0A4V3I3Z7_9PEZI|nr:hypothetical protein C8034_v007459 [Colletotrichum sidae]